MILTLSLANELIAQKDAHILKLTEKLESTQRQLATLQHQMEQMLKRLYGRKSEKINPAQLMFDSLILESLKQNQAVSETLPAAEATVEPGAVKTRKAS